jgi:hypothetical protein
MPSPNQGPCQSRKTAKNQFEGTRVAKFPNQYLVTNPKPRPGTFATPGASNRKDFGRGVSTMLGKLAGAWLGKKIAGKNAGGKSAILGYGAAAVARRSVPALAALTLGGWAFRKWRDRRRALASHPSDSSPASPS